MLKKIGIQARIVVDIRDQLAQPDFGVMQCFYFSLQLKSLGNRCYILLFSCKNATVLQEEEEEEDNCFSDTNVIGQLFISLNKPLLLNPDNASEAGRHLLTWMLLNMK